MRTIPGKPDQLDRKSSVMQDLYGLICKVPYIPSSGRYNITMSHERKFVWDRVAKVGTRTIFNHLKESEVYLDVKHASFIHYPKKTIKYLRANGNHRICAQQFNQFIMQERLNETIPYRFNYNFRN